MGTRSVISAKYIKFVCKKIRALPSLFTQEIYDCNHLVTFPKRVRNDLSTMRFLLAPLLDWP